MTSRGAASDDLEYQNFRIEISATGRGADRYRALVIESPAAEGRTEFGLRLDDEALSALTARFEAARQRNYVPDGEGEVAAAVVARQTPEAVLRQLGQELFDALFGDELKELWWRSVGQGDRPPRPLRLLLQLSLDDPETARLHALPWECLHPGRNRMHLLLSSDFSLVRYLSQGGVPSAVPRPARLRVLAVSAEVTAPGLPPLDLDAELEALRRELEGRDVELIVERNLTLDDLDDVLARHRPHVFHFLGHGGFSDAGDGSLHLSDHSGAHREVGAETLARHLEPGDDLRLVFLNACVSARASHRAPFAGMVPALVRQARVPAVLAMQRPVSDAAASRFAAEVYRHLTAGVSLDRAVHQGRRRLADGTEWATPVLFSRLPDGQLFAPAQTDVAPREGESDASAVRSPARWGGWAAVLALVVTLALAGVGLWPWLQDGPLGGPNEEVGTQGLLHRPSDEELEGSGEPRLEPGATEEDAAPAEPEPTPVEPPPATSPPTLYHLEDGGSVYLSELDSYASVTFNGESDFIYPTLDLDISDTSRAVERPRTVDFETSDGIVQLRVVSIDLEGRRLTLRVVDPESPGTAG